MLSNNGFLGHAVFSLLKHQKLKHQKKFGVAFATPLIYQD